jgi:2-(3-amino-3-carboxypropyl)histidine synthase
MDKNAYDFELEQIKKCIKKRRAQRVGMQMPEGLKTAAAAIAAAISKETGTDVILSGNSCYGACDVDEKLGAIVDVLFHFGHSVSFSFSVKDALQKKVCFIELRSSVDVKPVVEKAAVEIKRDCVGLTATVQHVHALKEAKMLLARSGKKAVIGKSRLKYEGQVLGCEFSSANVPCTEILFIGSGSFHPIGLALYTGKRIIAADPFTMQVKVFEGEEQRKKRVVAIARALDATSCGILIGMKSGQFNLREAIALRRKAVDKGLDAYLIAMDEIGADKLLGFNVDAFVNTACPRLAEDFTHFKTPVLSAEEFEVVLGERGWDDIYVRQ